MRCNKGDSGTHELLCSIGQKNTGNSQSVENKPEDILFPKYKTWGGNKAQAVTTGSNCGVGENAEGAHEMINGWQGEWCGERQDNPYREGSKPKGM